jgi:hypothetical protein
VLLFVVESLLARRHRRADWLWLCGGVVAAVGARLLLYGGFSSVAIGLDNNPLADASFGVRLWTAMRLFVLTVRVTLVPLNLSADYAGFEIQPDRHFAWEPFAGEMMLVLLAVAVWRWRRDERPAAAGVALFVLSWAVVSNILAPLPTIFAERLFYVAAAGAALAAAWLALRLWRSGRRALGGAWLVLVVGGNFVLGFVADRRWRDSLSLFGSAVEVSPGSPRAWSNYAIALQQAGDRTRAELAVRESLRLRPTATASALLGGLLDDRGDQAGAEQMFLQALRFGTDDPTVTRNVVVFYARHGRAAEALAILKPYLARHPDDAEAQLLLRRLAP